MAGHSHHGHSHDEDHKHGPDDAHAAHRHFHARSGAAPQVLTRAMLVTIAFMIVELVGGIFANSLALLSDAAHMLTDVGAILLSLFALWIAKMPRNSRMSYGYHRAEILGALTSGLLIWLISGLLVYEAAIRFQSPPDVKGPIVFVIALIGLGANLFSMSLLHREKKNNLNVKAAYLHMLSDSFGSIGAVIAGAVLWWTGWRLIDPVVTVAMAILMLVSSWGLVKEAVVILMESSPIGLDPDLVLRDLRAIPGVREVHDLHIWMVTSGKPALSVHLIAVEETQAMLSKANSMLGQKHRIAHTTIQIEHPDRFKSDRCYDCN